LSGHVVFHKGFLSTTVPELVLIAGT
jgi:hypothetical protein